LYLHKTEIKNIPKINPAHINMCRVKKPNGGVKEDKKMPPMKERQKQKKIFDLVIYRAFIYKNEGEEEDFILFAL